MDIVNRDPISLDEWTSVNISLTKFIETSTPYNNTIIYKSYTELTQYIHENGFEYQHLPPIYVYISGSSFSFSFEKTKHRLIMKIVNDDDHNVTVTIYLSFIACIYIDATKEPLLYNILMFLVRNKSGAINILLERHHLRAFSFYNASSELSKSLINNQNNCTNTKISRNLYCNVEIPTKLIYNIKKKLCDVLRIDELQQILDDIIYNDGFCKFKLFPINIRTNPKIDFFNKLLFRYNDYAYRSRSFDCSINVANSSSNIKYYSYQPIFYDISEMWNSDFDNFDIMLIQHAKNNIEYHNKILDFLLCLNNVGLIDDILKIILRYYTMHFATQQSYIRLERNYLSGVFKEKYCKSSSRYNWFC